MEKLLPRNSILGEDSTSEVIDTAQDDASFYLPELLQHLAIRGVEDLSSEEVNYLIEYFTLKSLDSNSGDLSLREAESLSRLRAVESGDTVRPSHKPFAQDR